MTPGDSVRVTIGGRMHDAEVLYTRGVSVRVRLADGREKTVPVDRVRPDRVRAVVEAYIGRAADDHETHLAANAALHALDERHDAGLPPEIREASRLRAVPKPKPPWRSSEYRAHVRRQTCCITYQPAEEAHHHGPHAMGRKGPDWTCIPLTHHEHDEFHRHGTFPGMSRAQTDAHAIKAQVRCMTAWCEARGLDYMTAVRDALARVVEGDD